MADVTPACHPAAFLPRYCLSIDCPPACLPTWHPQVLLGHFLLRYHPLTYATHAGKELDEEMRKRPRNSAFVPFRVVKAAIDESDMVLVMEEGDPDPWELVNDLEWLANKNTVSVGGADLVLLTEW